MTKYNIDDYDVFIFDFDGTIMDTEKYHYKTYLKVLNDYDSKIHLSNDEYFKLSHELDRSNFENIFKDFTINVYEKKAECYYKIIMDDKNKLNYIGNIDKFINKLKKKNKKTVIVTNSSITSINIIKKMYPLLNEFDKIYTKEDFTHKKPNPECYFTVADIYKNERMIGFEDSHPGIHALTQVKTIKPIHIKIPDYYYNDAIKNNYEIDEIYDYDCFE